MERINDILKQLRKRISEYRFEHRNEKDSVHVNILEIAICLSEYLAEKKRLIEPSEKVWFEGGWYVIQLFEGTKYEDLAKGYLEICDYLKKNDFSFFPEESDTR